MGNNCFTASNKQSGIRPCDTIKVSSSTSSSPSPIVKLSGSPSSLLTSYIRFALLFKGQSPRFISSDDDRLTSLQIGSEVVSAGPSPEPLLDFIERKFPLPPLPAEDDEGDEETTSCLVKLTCLQHKSVTWHVERMLRWADDLATRGGRRTVDPALGSPKMELKKFGNSYSLLLELMFEHAQMEERVLFPIFDKADPGMCKSANEEHARALPIMNGIKEAIKSVGVLDFASPSYQEALSNLSTRFKTLQKHCKQHFEEEERDLLPLMEAMELSKEQEKRELMECLNVMQGTHSHMLNFFLEGLLPLEAMHYLRFIMDQGKLSI